jgi:hypothetical protein
MRRMTDAYSKIEPVARDTRVRAPCEYHHSVQYTFTMLKHVATCEASRPRPGRIGNRCHSSKEGPLRNSELEQTLLSKSKDKSDKALTDDR